MIAITSARVTAKLDQIVAGIESGCQESRLQGRMVAARFVSESSDAEFCDMLRVISRHCTLLARIEARKKTKRRIRKCSA